MWRWEAANLELQKTNVAIRLVAADWTLQTTVTPSLRIDAYLLIKTATDGVTDWNK